MKKVIFISALAIAAAVSCTKSDIVDTKFNEQIGFETYVGRDAMTKASVENATTLQATGFGVYGFYTGKDSFVGSSSKINLWANDKVTYTQVTEDETTKWVWSPATPKFWTNETDQYTFLAYAPFANENNINPSGAIDGTVPTVSFAVPEKIEDQVDLLYSNNLINTKKGATALVFNHALSRITVKAKDNIANDDFTYKVYGVQLKGDFIAQSTLTLWNNAWATNAKATTQNYVIKPYNSETVNGVETPKVDGISLTEADYDFATFVKDGEANDNYIMVIPVSVKDAELIVTYTTSFKGQESTPMTKTVKVTEEFAQGKAYSLNLAFAPNTTDTITFTISVTEWKAEGENAADNSETPVTPTPSNPVVA